MQCCRSGERVQDKFPPRLFAHAVANRFSEHLHIVIEPMVVSRGDPLRKTHPLGTARLVFCNRFFPVDQGCSFGLANTTRC
jgi:hypothetical protein